jgi:hypothetical protein
LESDIESWTNRRDSLGAQIKAMMAGAEFEGKSIDEREARNLISQAQALLADASNVANGL